MKKIFTCAFLIFCFTPVFGQTINFNPKIIEAEKDEQIEVEINFDLANITNAINLDIEVNGNLKSLEFIKNTNSKLFYLPSKCGESFVVGNRICLSIVTLESFFESSQSLGSILLVSSEKQKITFNVTNETKIVVDNSEVVLNSLNLTEGEELINSEDISDQKLEENVERQNLPIEERAINFNESTHSQSKANTNLNQENLIVVNFVVVVFVGLLLIILRD